MANNFEALMDPGLRAAAQEYGGKTGVLMWLRAYCDELRNHILPCEVFNILNENLGGFRRKIAALCREYGTDKVIIRTSTPGDLYAMVDVMPTRVCRLDEIEIVVAAMREECRKSELLFFAAMEGTEYDPDGVTFSITPYIGGMSATLTEHPNQVNTHLVDVVRIFDEVEAYHTGYDFRDGKIIDEYGKYYVEDLEYARSAHTLFAPLRATGALSDDVACQHEVIFRNGFPILTQVRNFAPKKFADFCLVGENVEESCRTFGVTDADLGEYEDLLSVYSVWGRNECMVRERRVPYMPYMLSPHAMSDKLGLDECPQWMRAFVPEHPKPQLSHQATRFVQMCLRREGVALLNTMRAGVKYLKGYDFVRLRCDGYRSLLEGVDMNEI